MHGNTVWDTVCHVESTADFDHWLRCVRVLLRRAMDNDVVDYLLLSHKFALLSLPDLLCQFETRMAPHDLNDDESSSDEEPLTAQLWLARARARLTPRFVCNGFRICY